MAQQERRIPARPSPRAPPPPRSFAPPPPPSYSRQYEKHERKQQKKQKTRRQLKRSQIKTFIGIIILFILYFICIFLALTIQTDTDSSVMESDQDTYAWWFRIPDLMSNKIPTSIEVETSEDVEFFILRAEDYNDDLTRSDLRNFAMSGGINEGKKFTYFEEMNPGEYYVVTYAHENNQEIDQDYSLSRYFLMPFLWLISLLFMIPIIIGLVWLLVLQSRKGHAPIGEPDPHGTVPAHEPERQYHDGRRGYYGPQEHYDYPGDDGGYDEHYHDDYRGHGHTAQYHSPPKTHPAQSYQQQYPPARRGEYEHDYDAKPRHHDYYDQRQPSEHEHHRGHRPGYHEDAGYDRGHGYYDHDQHAPAPPPQPRRAPPQHTRGDMPPPMRPSYQEQHEAGPRPRRRDYHEERAKDQEITTVPCKCGEVIVVTDPTRPLRIKCPRCGRRGILEGKEKSEEDDIFY